MWWYENAYVCDVPARAAEVRVLRDERGRAPCELAEARPERRRRTQQVFVPSGVPSSPPGTTPPVDPSIWGPQGGTQARARPVPAHEGLMMQQRLLHDLLNDQGLLHMEVRRACRCLANASGQQQQLLLVLQQRLTKSLRES